MKSLLTILGLCLSMTTWAQNGAVFGKIVDVKSQETVVGAKVFLGNDFKMLSDVDGNYRFENVPYGTYNLVISMASFDTLRLVVSVNQPENQQNIELGFIQELQEMQVTGNIAQDRKTPVAVTTLGKKEIDEELGSQDLPMVLNSKPGVHATQQGGGDGDARITIRGFDQRNVGVMIDGVPVNDMENGWVYWSNWFGLDAITQQIQVQRGLGATKLSMPSVGGTMNIITDNTAGKREIKAEQEYGSGNFTRTSLSYKSGSLKNGWGVLFSGSYKQGNGWIDGLSTEGGFYYLKVQKKFKNHVLSLSGFGAPQKHNQRSFNQPIDYWNSKYAANLFEGSEELYRYLVNYNQNMATISKDQYNSGLAAFGLDTNSVQPYMYNFVDTTGARNEGIRFNTHWGYYTDSLTGKTTVKAERYNFYHKPQITLKDFWSVNKKLSWSNMLYVSIGRGGGGRLRNSGGIIYDSTDQIDWNAIEYNNRYKTLFGQTFSTADATYHPTLRKSSQVETASMNNHNWYGGISQFDYKATNNLNIAGGVDFRFYRGEHYVELRNLLGGDYWVNEANLNSGDPMKVVGDKVGWEKFHNHRDGFVNWFGGFLQGEYSTSRFTTFVNLSVVTNGYKGVDYFRKKELHDGDTIIYVGAKDTVDYNGKTYTNDSPELQYNSTGWKYLTGFTFKAGANYNLNEKNNVFFNLGYLSRTPLFSNVVDNNTNTFFLEIANEKIYAFELGYGYRSKKISINANGYYTYWENKPFPFGVSVPDPNDPSSFIQANLNGMDALHMGAEVDVAYNILPSLTVEGMVSMGDWTWQSAETLFVQDIQFTFDAKGVHVGDAAQSTYAGSLRWAFVKNGYVKFKYTYFDRYFSNFDPFSLTGNNGGKESWEIPGYGLLSAHAGYNLKFEKTALLFRANVFNLTNALYISDARNNQNGSGFNANSAGVFFGQGLTFNLSLGFEF